MKQPSVLACLLLAMAMIAFCEDDAKDAGITRAQAAAILNELRQIRQLLELPPRTAAPVVPQKRSMKVDGGYVLGKQDALLTMIEFTDYQCPYCREFEENTFSEIRKQYVDTGKMRFVSRNLPLDIHPDAMQAAEAALCAGDQGQFWPMREVLFRRESLLTQPAVLGSARGLQIDVDAFQSCLESGKHKGDILKDIEDAKAMQINATPSFFIGKTTAYGVEGYVMTGAQPFAQFDARLKETLTGH